MRRQTLFAQLRTERGQGVLTPEPINSSQSSSSLNSSLRPLAGVWRSRRSLHQQRHHQSSLPTTTKQCVDVDPSLSTYWRCASRESSDQGKLQQFNCGVYYTWIVTEYGTYQQSAETLLFTFCISPIPWYIWLLWLRPISCMKVPFVLWPNHTTYGMSIRIFKIYIRPVCFTQRVFSHTTLILVY